MDTFNTHSVYKYSLVYLVHLSLLLQRLRSVTTHSATRLHYTNTIFSTRLYALQVDTPIQSFTSETEYASSHATQV